MKKSLLTIMLTLVGMTASAQWDNPYLWKLDYDDAATPSISGAYSGSKPIAVQIKANGEVVNDEIRIAAFIDESCRALYAGANSSNNTWYVNNNNNGPVYTLRVWGNTFENELSSQGSDMNKSIVFGIYYRNLLFRADETTLGMALSFDGEERLGSLSNPIVINLDIPAELNIQPIEESVDFPYTKKLNNIWSYVYYDNSGTAYTPKNNAVIMTELIPSWDPGQNGDAISFDGQEITVSSEVEGDIFLRVAGRAYDDPTGGAGMGGWFEVSGSTRVKFTQAEHPVTSITCRVESIQVNKYDNLYDALGNHIVVGPENASNKAYTLEAANEVPGDFFVVEPAMDNVLTAAKGTGSDYYRIIIKSVSNPTVTSSVLVKVYAPVEDIEVTGEVVTINKGDNIYDVLDQYITILPEDATDKSYTLTPMDEMAFSGNEAVVGSGTNGTIYSIMVTSNDNLNVNYRTIDVYVNAAPETITCESETIQVNKGDNVKYMLEEYITVGPEDATDQEWTYSFYTEGVVDTDGNAMKAGIHKAKVFCPQYPAVSKDIYVNVMVIPNRMYLSNETYSYKVPVGTDIYGMLKEYIVFDPEDATETDYEFLLSEAASNAIVDGIAKREGEYTGAITVASKYSDNLQFTVDIEIFIAATGLNAPESISMEVGQSLSDYLNSETVTIQPQEANQAFTLEYSQNAFDANGTAMLAGSYEVTVKTVAEPQLTKTVSVLVAEAMKFTYPSYIITSKREETIFELSYITEGLGIDVSKLEVFFSNSNNDFGYTPNIYMSDNSGLRWTIEPSLLAGEYQISVVYNGNEIESDEPGTYNCDLMVSAEVSFNNNGWDWIYVPGSLELTENILSNYNIDDNNKIIEVRSQNGMLYNDPEYGFFGDIMSFSAEDGMYKIKASFEDENDCYITVGPHWEQSFKQLYRGYNWIGYYNEWDMDIETFNGLIGEDQNKFSEGDFILSKDGIAIFDAQYNAWISSDNFVFETGKGYIFYSASQPYMDNMSFESVMPQTNSLRSRKAKAAVESVWEYDASQFADNMAVVAELKNVDIPENYTVGAFVDGECRGMGKVVKNGIMLISVAGKTGEQVSFRLHNEITGEFSEVKETTPYKMIAGSLQAPFSLTADGNGTTGIDVTDAVNEDDIVAIYTLGGQRVEEMTEGNIYIVQVRIDGKIVTKKVKK